MKVRLSLATQFFFCIFLLSAAVIGQTTEFTYQGRLLDNTAPPTASYDFQFSLWDALTSGNQVGTTLTRSNVAVAGGVFTVKLDFGATAFPGADRFLQIAARPSMGGSYTALTPRHAFTSAPYAIKSAGSTSADSLSAACVTCVTDGQIMSLAGNKLTGVITGDGAGITNINGSSIAVGSITSSQLSAEAVPNTTPYKLLGSLRWDLLKPMATFTTPSLPFGVAFDGSNIWVVNLVGNNVRKLRASDGANLGTFSVGTSPYFLAFDGTHIWTANFNSSNVTKLRASDGANLGAFPVGTNPTSVAFDGANIWTTNATSNNVTKLRASDGANLGTFAVGTDPHAIAFDGANMWVVNRSSANVTKLRASDGFNLGTFAVGSNPRALAFDGANIWVANQATGNVTKLRASDGANLGNFATGNNPHGVAFDGSNIWVANLASDTVTKLRASDGANLGSFAVADGPVSLAFDGTNMWVANYNANLITRLFPAFPQP